MGLENTLDNHCLQSHLVLGAVIKAFLNHVVGIVVLSKRNEFYKCTGKQDEGNGRYGLAVMAPIEFVKQLLERHDLY